jgi:hypothetical protein
MGATPVNAAPYLSERTLVKLQCFTSLGHGAAASTAVVNAPIAFRIGTMVPDRNEHARYHIRALSPEASYTNCPVGA